MPPKITTLASTPPWESHKVAHGRVMYSTSPRRVSTVRRRASPPPSPPREIHVVHTSRPRPSPPRVIHKKEVVHAPPQIRVVERVVHAPPRVVEKRVEVPVPGPTEVVEVEKIVEKRVEVPVPGPTQYVDRPGPKEYVEVEKRVEVPVPGPTQYVDRPGPKEYVEVEKRVEVPVPGPTQYIDRMVPGPTQYVDRTVPGPKEYVAVEKRVEVPVPGPTQYVDRPVPGPTQYVEKVVEKRVDVPLPVPVPVPGPTQYVGVPREVPSPVHVVREVVGVPDVRYLPAAALSPPASPVPLVPELSSPHSLREFEAATPPPSSAVRLVGSPPYLSSPLPPAHVGLLQPAAPQLLAAPGDARLASGSSSPLLSVSAMGDGGAAAERLRQREAWLAEARAAHRDGVPCEWCDKYHVGQHAHPCPFSPASHLHY